MRDNMFLETADRIGRRLCRDAVWSGNACNWLGWALEVVGPTWTPVYKAQNSTIYDGTAGIAYAAIEIGEALGDERIVSSGLRELRNPRNVQPNETYVDIIGGCAGAIQMLIDI